MDYKKAFQVLATYVDVSVNTSLSESTRINAQHCAYWFKQVIEYGPENKYTQNYIERIVNCSTAYRYNMVSFLMEFGYYIP